MTCPKCACERSKVLETRNNVDHVERVRRCTNDKCGHVFKTYEYIDEKPKTDSTEA